MQSLWGKWKARHNKHYRSVDEDKERFANFEHFVSLVDNSNRNRGVVVDEIKNEMADLSADEFDDLYRGCALLADAYDAEMSVWRVPASIDLGALPTSVDWRSKGAVTPVKDQGQCGSCWSFSTTGVLESHWEILSGELQSLSEQELVSCDIANCDGCDGGWPYKAIEWVSKNGAETEASDPYTSGGGDSGTCDKADGYQFVESTEEAMAAYVASYGPSLSRWTR